MLLLYKTLPRASAGLLRRFSAASSPLSNLGSAVSHLSLEEINKALPDLLEADQTDKHLADLCAYLQQIENLTLKQTEGLPLADLSSNAQAWVLESMVPANELAGLLLRNVHRLSSENLVTLLSICSGKRSAMAANTQISLSVKQLHNIEKQVYARFENYYQIELAESIIALALAGYSPNLLLSKFHEHERLSKLNKEGCLKMLKAINALIHIKKSSLTSDLVEKVLFEIRKMYVIRMEPSLAIDTLRELITLNSQGKFLILQSQSLKKQALQTVVTLFQLLRDHTLEISAGDLIATRALFDLPLVSSLVALIAPNSVQFHDKKSALKLLHQVLLGQIAPHNIEQTCDILPHLLHFSKKAVSPALARKLYTILYENSSLISEELGLSRIAAIVDTLTPLYLQSRGDMLLEPFMKFTENQLRKDPNPVPIDVLARLVYSFTKIGILNHENAQTSILFHSLISQMANGQLSAQLYVPTLWAFVVLEHPASEALNPYIGWLFMQSSEIQLYKLNLEVLHDQMIDFYNAFSALKLYVGKDLFPGKLIQQADQEMLAFAKSFYRRVKKPEREKGTVRELAGMLNDCRAGYKLDHWMNGDLHLDIKVKGSNKGVLVREQNHFNENEQLVGDEMLRLKVCGLKQYKLLAIRDKQWGEKSPVQQRATVERFLEKE